MDSNIRIAFITPEAPPFSGGGIATFINNITKGLYEANIFCEVFLPAINEASEITSLNQVTYHKVSTNDLNSFRKDVVPYFLKRHLEKHFTIVESCEIHASLFELMENKRADLKYVIRVQMPEVYQSWLNNYYESRWIKLRYVLGALRRFRWDLGFWNKRDVKKSRNPEYLVCKNADAIIAPSNSFKDWLENFWKLPASSITVIYHLFDFSLMAKGKLVHPDIPKKEDAIKVLFVGKLNAHKGVVNLARAAKNILEKYNKVQFILIGEDWPTKYKWRRSMTGDVLKEIINNNDRFTITGKINYNDLYDHYSSADICIFPSLWEAWGYTCTEAMSMGKAVIGSKYGGMADAIEPGVNGLLIDPFSVADIENKLVILIKDKKLREKLGKTAVDSVQNKLNFEKLVKENITFYNNLLNS